MSKDPAFLFYPGDWLGGTLGMTFEEKGAYIELLMLQFNRGHMEGHMIGQVVGQLWDKLQSKFIQDENGLWYNERLEIEKEKRKSFINSRKNNIKGKNQYNKKEGHKNGHMTSHMENENKNIIKTNNVSPEFDFLAEDSEIGIKKKAMYDKLMNNQQWHNELYRDWDLTFENIKRLLDQFLRKKFAGISQMEHIGEYKRHFINSLSTVFKIKQLSFTASQEKMKNFVQND